MYFSKTKNHSILTCNWRRKKRALKSLLNSSVVWRILRDQNILSVRKYLPFYLCFWLYWDKNVYNTKCMYINLTLKIKPNAKIQMNNMKFFSWKNCIQVFVYCQPRCPKSFFYPNFFFLLFCCVYILIFSLRHFGIHEYSIMNRIYCFAPSIRVAPSFYIFDLKKCNTYLPT